MPGYSPCTRLGVYDVSLLFSYLLLLVAFGSFPTTGQMGTPTAGRRSHQQPFLYHKRGQAARKLIRRVVQSQLR
ncbi:MAG: hypothetical protein ACXVCM_12160 [Ktedonobacteraceae bacterium]